jgi:hypothetical protein
MQARSDCIAGCRLRRIILPQTHADNRRQTQLKKRREGQNLLIFRAAKPRFMQARSDCIELSAFSFELFQPAQRNKQWPKQYWI